MQITINVARDLLVTIPESQSSDTVTYEIFDSDGVVVQSGSMTFVRDEIWKVSNFTPDDFGSLILKAHDTTLDSKRENFYEVVGTPPPDPQSGDWGADLIVGTNSWATGDEAEEYFANRYAASDFWDDLTNAQKKSAMITAFNQLRACNDYELPTDTDPILIKAQCEQALFLVIHAADALRRRGLQAQGVVQAGIVKETYREITDSCMISPDALSFLDSFAGDDVTEPGVHIADIDRDECIDAGDSLI